MDFSLPANAPLLLAFAKLPDPRKERNRLYPLIDIVSVVLMGIICGANDIMSAYLWAQHRKDWFVSMGLCLNGLPSYDTLNRVFRFLDPKEFNRCFMDWVSAIAGHIQGVIAIDGKTLCNSGDTFRAAKPVHLVNAFATENQMILGQLATDSKSNEITAIPELLKLLTINGSVITIDAMGCQKDIVQQIKSQEGEYVIALKGNQGNLHAEIENFFQQAKEVLLEESGCDFTKMLEKNRGRVEERMVWACNFDWLDNKSLIEEWVGIKSAVCVQSNRTYKGKTTTEFRYYISSLKPVAERHGCITRAHWGVENKVHWHLDVTFGEDQSKIRAGHGAENVSLMRKLALNLLKADTSLKAGIENKRKMAGWNPDYLLKILGVK
jgi:predicted transposase YbfD/YdcC